MACQHSSSDGPCPECSASASATDRTFVRSGSAPIIEDAPPRDHLAPGARVGRYVVLEVLGEGGMGVVYAAFDPQLDRKVAIKLLRAGETGSLAQTDGQARLQREAQAMAQLSHPNVVPIYDVGAFGDSVFMAMELIRGVTLDKWLKQRPRSWREIRTVFDAAGHGLLAAHDAGLIHRDFKPANVLVGEDGRARVTDFGLARSASAPEPRSAPAAPAPTASGNRPVSVRDSLTQLGSLMGTPGYMAPEQYALAGATPATDQFSFCVSLYEALYRVRPFAGDTLPQLSAAAASGKVPPAPKGSRVPSWVHALILKGLAPEQTQRHVSMRSLLTALAKDPARTRRRWGAAGIGGVVLLSLALGLNALVRSQARICRGTDRKLEGVWDDGVKARARSAFAATGKAYASDAWERTQRQMDAYARGWLSARTEACESSGLKAGETDKQLALRLSCLDRRLDEFGALANVLTNADAEVVGRSNAAVSGLSSLERCSEARTLGDPRKALPADRREAVDRVSQRVSRGKGLLVAGKYALARAEIEPAAEEARRLGFPPLQAAAEQALGTLEVSSSHPAQAKAALERAASAAEAAGDDDLVAQALTDLVSTVGCKLERPDQGRTLAVLTQGVIERLGGNELLSGKLSSSLGDVEWQDGNRDGSVVDYRKALIAESKTLGPDDLQVSLLHYNLGWVLMEQGKLAEARDQVELALATQLKTLGVDHPDLRATWNALGAIAVEQDDPQAAVRNFKRALALSESAMGPESAGLVAALSNLAIAYAVAGHPEESLGVSARADAILDHQKDVRPTDRATVMSNRALALRGLRRFAEAEAQSRRALAAVEPVLGKDHPLVAGYTEELGNDLCEQHRCQEALPFLERARSILAKTGAGSVDSASNQSDIGYALMGLGRWEDARAELESALAVFEKGGRRPFDAAVARLRLAEVLWRTRGDRERARGLAEKARALDASLDREGLVKGAQTWLAAHPR